MDDLDFDAPGSEVEMLSGPDMVIVEEGGAPCLHTHDREELIAVCLGYGSLPLSVLHSPSVSSWLWWEWMPDARGWNHASECSTSSFPLISSTVIERLKGTSRLKVQQSTGCSAVPVPPLL